MQIYCDIVLIIATYLTTINIYKVCTVLIVKYLCKKVCSYVAIDRHG